MEARLINDQRQWNEFIEGAVQCNVTQSYEWGQLLTTLDGEVLYVGVVDDGGKICAAMLLLVSRVAVSNSVYFYAPRGPIIDNPDSPAMTVLLNYVKALAHKHHAFMLKVEPGVQDNDAVWLAALHRRGFIANPEALHLRHEWVLDIRPDEQTLLAGMKKTWRYCVRLASRKDVTVRRSESLADIATFYNILQTTSQRDTFMIYDKSFYEKLVELYGKSGNVALFIAEYEGQALGAALLVKMGHWCWYMYGASSNEHRDRMPNHLLQWTAMRWAKEQGCWYYNFRGIPDVLEESQPMWGVYLFKSGFGGYAMRSLETHDLAYNPLLYKLYRSWLDGRSWLKDVRAKRHAKQIDTEQQSDSEQPKDAQQITQSKVEKPSKPDEVQAEAGSKPAVQKQPKPSSSQQKQLKHPPLEPYEAALQAPENPSEVKQEVVVSPLDIPIAVPEPKDVVVEEKSDSNIIDDYSQESVGSVTEISAGLPEVEQALGEVKSDDKPSEEPRQEESASPVEFSATQPAEKQAIIDGMGDANLSLETPEEEATKKIEALFAQLETDQVTREAESAIDTLSENNQNEVTGGIEVPIEQIEFERDITEQKSNIDISDEKVEMDTQKVRIPSFSVQPDLQAKPLEVQDAQVSQEDQSIYAETQIQPQVEAQMQPVTEQLGGGLSGEEEQARPEFKQAQAEELIQPEHRDMQVKPTEAKVEGLEHGDVEVEPEETKVQEPVMHVKTKAEEVVEELERRANIRKLANTSKQTEEELERQAFARKQADEDLEDLTLLNEETQKLPRVKMAQKYSSGRRSMGPNGTYDGMNGRGGKKE